LFRVVLESTAATARLRWQAIGNVLYQIGVLHMKLSLALAALGVCLFSEVALAQRVRVVHASPDAPAVDIRVDGQRAIDRLPFTEYTDYVALPVGQHTFQVYVAGTDTRVTEITASLTAGQDVTVIATGFVTAGKPNPFKLVVLVDNNTLPADGRAHVRVVHAAPSAPSVNVYFGAPFLSVMNRDAVLMDVPYGAASGYLPVTSLKQYQARITPSTSKAIAIESSRLLLSEKLITTFIAVDNAGGGAPFQILSLIDRVQ
jgi:hypothetical protein